MSADQDQVIKYYDRRSGKLCEEVVMGEGAIRWAYQTISGRIFSRFIFGNALLSRLLGLYFDSPFSRWQIPATIRDLQIDESEFLDPVSNFRSFNAFFTRKLKPHVRPFPKASDIIVSPADGRILVYPDAGTDSIIDIKGMQDSVGHFIADAEMAEKFSDCAVAVVRLCPADYHRYHFPCDGEVVSSGKIPGEYHSVNPLALEAVDNVFCRNLREYTLCHNDYSDFIMAEVGAFGVAGIVQTYQQSTFTKMVEKGYFKFGGSTVVLIFPKKMVNFSDDLLEQSAAGCETLLHVGDEIGHFTVRS